MFKIFTYIDYVLKTKQGIEKPEELLSETGFGFVEIYFYLSFVFFGVLVCGLGALSYFYNSLVAGIFAGLFLLVLVFDIWLFIKIRSFVERASKKIVEISKKSLNRKVNHTIEVEVVQK